MTGPEEIAGYIRANTEIYPVPLCPQIRLHLLKPHAPMIGQAPLHRGEPHLFDYEGPRPYWAFAWAGGQGLARFILDNPGVVSARAVVDCGSGSGLCAIAAALSKAASVAALDVDPVALMAVEMNARLNDVEVCTVRADMSLGGFDGAGTILAADAFYSCREYARLLDHAAAGGTVLIGDPTCRGFPKHCCDELMRYRVKTYPDLETWTADVQILKVKREGRQVWERSL